MATIVEGGAASLGTMAFGQVSRSVMDSLAETSRYFTEHISDRAKSFYDTVRESEKDLIHSRLNGYVKRSIRGLASLWSDNSIRPLTTLRGIKLANEATIPYIMANPVLRKKYHDNEVDGYSDTYVDEQPGEIGATHVDYMEITNGVFMENEKGELYATEYYNDLLYERNELDIEDKHNIVTLTWPAVETFLDEGKDPSDIY